MPISTEESSSLIGIGLLNVWLLEMYMWNMDASFLNTLKAFYETQQYYVSNYNYFRKKIPSIIKNKVYFQ
jgi:hypothetical protein